MAQRIQTIQRHLQSPALSTQACSGADPKKAKTGVFRIPQETERFPDHRHEVLKWNGWGYNDSLFYMNDEGTLHSFFI